MIAKPAEKIKKRWSLAERGLGWSSYVSKKYVATSQWSGTFCINKRHNELESFFPPFPLHPFSRRPFVASSTILIIIVWPAGESVRHSWLTPRILISSPAILPLVSYHTSPQAVSFLCIYSTPYSRWSSSLSHGHIQLMVTLSHLVPDITFWHCDHSP